MQTLLFSPQGRILKRRFWQGLVVVTVGAVILQAAQVMIGPSLGLAAGIFLIPALALMYCNICVYAKRFHDAGTTGWWILAVWAGSFALQFIEGLLFSPIFLGEEGRAIQAEAAERLGQGELAIFMQAQERVAEILLPLSLLTTVVNAVIIGFIVGSLATEPRQNKHGPVPGSPADTFS